MLVCSSKKVFYDCIQFNGENEKEIMKFLNADEVVVYINKGYKKTVIFENNLELTEDEWVLISKEKPKTIKIIDDENFKKLYDIGEYRNGELSLIVGGRRSGKTTKLIKKAQDENLQIITNSKMSAKSVELLAKQLGYKIKQPITFSRFKNRKMYEMPDEDYENGVLIDEAIPILGEILETKIKGVTISI